MTEEEAKGKKCCGAPMLAVLLRPHADEPSAQYCIGSKCMAWRWKYGDYAKPQGYCGLAGKP